MIQKKLILIILFFILFTGNLYAGSVTLTWTANQETDLAGYKIYYDIDSGSPYNGTTEMGGIQQGNTPITIWLNGKRPAGNTTDLELIDNANPEITLTIIDTSKDWYFVVTAFDDYSHESGYSNEVCTADYVPPQTPGLVYNIKVSNSEIKEQTNDYGDYTGEAPLPSIVQNIKVLEQQ